MPDLYAEPIENVDEERLRGDENEKGIAFVVPWLVHGTRDWREALEAPLLPRIGDGHPSRPTAVVVQRSPGRYGGETGRPGVQGGFVVLQISYAEPQRSGKSAPPSGPSSNYTVLDLQRKTVTVKWGWNPGVPPSDGDTPDVGPINDGDGVAKNYATISASVSVFTPQPPAPATILRMIGLASVGALNLGPLTLPKLLDTDWTGAGGQGGSPGTILTLEPGQAQYAGFAQPVRRTGSGGQVWWETVHKLELLEDWLVQWEGKDQQGKPTSSNAATIDPWRDMSGLW